MRRPSYLQDQGYSAGPVLVSYLGVVYQRGFFDDRVFSYPENCQQCRFQERNGLQKASKGLESLAFAGFRSRFEAFRVGFEMLLAQDEDDMWFSAHLALKGIRRFVIGAALGVQERSK